MATHSTTSNDGSYELAYRLRTREFGDPHRRIEVHASPEQVERLVEDGYLVREHLLTDEHLRHLRSALDEVIAADFPESDPRSGVTNSRQFGGLFLSNLADKHVAFLDLLQYPPIVTVARAVLGPQVLARGASARITFPDGSNQETHWHFHQRLVPDPLPPFFSRPHTVEALVYLDDADDANGPLCVLPGSHQWFERDLPDDDYADKPGQAIHRVPAGSLVLTHGALWHRALPTRPEGTVRRLLILGYGPTWMRGWSPPNTRPATLTDERLAAADQETRELLVGGGYT
jgi:ectoine hydroxylase-related dioxygenase (phytanoyl-CoA dioxygenase family)